MKNTFQKATKILIAVLITLVVSCQNDDEHSVSTAVAKSKNIKTINIDQLKPKIINDEILLDKLSHNFKKKNYRRTENGYAFDLDSIKQYENGDYSSYTVSAEKIVPDSSNYIYKLLIEENQDTIITSMLTFEFKDGNLVPIVKEDFTSNTLAKLECITVTIMTDCTCHTHGSASCTHPTYTTVSSCSGGGSSPGNGQIGGTPTTTPTNPGGGNPVVVIDEEDVWLKFNNFFDRLNNLQKEWMNNNPDAKDDMKNYLWNKGSSGSSQAFIKNIINEIINTPINPLLPNIILVNSDSNNQITNINEYLKCFNLNQSATFTLYVDQPTPNSNAPWSGNPLGDINVGHTFIGIKQGNITRVLGFYPKNAVTLSNPSSAGICENDSGHNYDVAISYNIDSTKLNKIINYIKNFANSQYNLNSYNCSDFGMNVTKNSGLTLPSAYGTWGNPITGSGSGDNPGQLGQNIRNLPTPTGATKTTSTGSAASNTGTCN